MIKIIACNVFMREVCHCVARGPSAVDVEFTELGEHVHSPSLRAILQQKIDATEQGAKKYDAVGLLFGLCGNATVGLIARQTQLVIPRAHDCCTILLGSKAAFVEHFGAAPSTPFSSAGYMERGQYFLRVDDGQPTVHMGDGYQELVAKYGAEDAQFVWESMHPKDPANDRAVFIHIPETTPADYPTRFTAKAAEEGKNVVVLPGSLRLVDDLVAGRWSPDDFLIVPPGHRIAGVYDHAQVMRAEKENTSPL